jgi:hypothetical protein
VGVASSSSAPTTFEAPAGSEWPENPVRWNGWGYKDTYFDVNEDGEVCLRGDRYEFSGQTMPNLRTFMEKLGVDISQSIEQNAQHPTPDPPLTHAAFIAAIEGHYKRFSTDDDARVFHSHGHTAQVQARNIDFKITIHRMKNETFCLY